MILRNPSHTIIIPAGGSVTYISSTSNEGGSDTASIAVPIDAQTDGRLLLMCIVSTGQGAFTPDGSWTLSKYQPYFFGSRDVRVYQKISNGESGTYDTTVPFSFWCVTLTVLSTIDTTTPVDASNSSEAFTTSYDTGSFTISSNGMAIVFYAGSFNGIDLTLDADLTSRISIISSNVAPRIYVGTQSISGSQNYISTTATNDGYAAIGLAIKPV